MNSRSGGAPRWMPSFTVIWPFITGATASSLMRAPTGAMMKTVRKSDSPISTWFGGISCVPSACRRK